MDLKQREVFSIVEEFRRLNEVPSKEQWQAL